MHRTAFLIFILFLSHIVSTSAQVFRQKFELKESENFGINPLENKYDHRALPVLAEDGRHLLLLSATSGLIQVNYLRKGSLREIKSFASQVPEAKPLNSMIGAFQLNEEKYAAIFADRKKENFAAFEIDLTGDTVRTTDFSLSLDNERTLQAFNAKGEFFILTMSARSSILKLYRVFRSQRGSISLSRYAYDFSTEEQDKTLPNLYKELMEYIVRGNQQVVLLHSGQDNDVVAGGSYFKLHVSDEKAILTMDHIHGRTSIYEMILDSKLKGFSLVPYPDFVTANPYLYTSNSQLLGDTLVQVALGKEDLSVFLHDRTTEEMIAEYSIPAKALAQAAGNLIDRNDTIGGKGSAKAFQRIYKDLYKNQVAVRVHRFGKNSISMTVATSRPVYSSSDPQTEAFIRFRQSLSEGLSSFTVTLEEDEEEIIARRFERSPMNSYEALHRYRVKKNIKDPIIESMAADDESLYYVWYSIFTRQVIVAKLPRDASNPHYDLSEY